ncbi:hypothetical protein BDY19DRAFT_898587 [Irpex rosettiformis]|uniref:Uncharacterized protein n=1 Tax=Irpex rosettiformis TaxID=378272 RepID=A0ACB8TQR4_9APHY|nr:hypothetical protein BDY19DRAFT_898587 [Irpex rosettiformis]
MASTRWSPATITTCEPTTQPYYAPCIAERTYGAIKGEELVYPDFQLREPIFAPSRLENDREEWRTFVEGIRERAARCSDEWYCYRGQHGQNIILANATYTGNPPADTWSDEACMSDGVSLRGISVLAEDTQLTDAEYAATYPIDSLLIATSPDSWSFQHFLDRITHIVAQGAPLARNVSSIEAVTGRTPVSVVAELWDTLGFSAARVHHQSTVAAKEIIFGCRTPLSHPWLSLRSLETFGLNNSRVPITERKKVVYFSRSEGHTLNGGRRVLNEGDLLTSIRALLVERDQGEELVMFRQEDFPSQHELMMWFESNVRAVIGPHGGALYNHRWTGVDTLVLEMTPTSRPSQMFWEEASMLGQVYANLILPSGMDTNMNADIPAIIEILKEYLGKPDPRGPAITEAYRWHAPEVMEPS